MPGEYSSAERSTVSAEEGARANTDDGIRQTGDPASTADSDYGPPNHGAASPPVVFPKLPSQDDLRKAAQQVARDKEKAIIRQQSSRSRACTGCNN